jgi:hypothetical protein
MSIGLPSITIQFQQAAKAVQAQLKQGTVGLILRDAAVEQRGVHVLPSKDAIPSALSESTRESIARAFLGSDRGVPRLVIVAIIDPADATGAAITAALKLLESYVIDYIVGPDDITNDEADLLADWVLDQRKLYRPVKAVLPKNAADNMGIINYDMGDVKVGTSTFPAAKACGRLAGVFAGIPPAMSSTFAVLSEVTEVPEMTVEEQTAAIAAGKLILIHDGMKAKIARGVNSLTTVPAGGSEDWKKIHIVEGMDLINYYVRSTIEDAWVGRYANSYDNKMILISALQAFFYELESKEILQRGSSSVDLDIVAQEKWLRDNNVDTSKMNEQQIREANTGSWVFLVASGRLLDAMEDFKLLFYEGGK